MPTVEISFLGVCTIFRNLSALIPPGGNPPNNRVVLARTTPEFITHTGVLPHIAKLHLFNGHTVVQGPNLPPADPPEPNVFALDGVQLKIRNATNDALTPAWGIDCLPSLQAHLYRDLGPPADSVHVPSKPNVQAWFDFQGGVARSFVMKATGADHKPCTTVPSISILTLETEHDPELEYTPFPGTFPPDTPSTVVRLTPNGSEPVRIHVSNFALGELVKDDNRDFLLNYRLCETFPPLADVAIPVCNTCTIESPGTYHTPRCGDAGPGCSNTTYP